MMINHAGWTTTSRLWFMAGHNWLTDSFIGGPQLADGQFYTKDKNRMSNYGIGTDTSFTCEELFHFLYRLYKVISENL